MAARLLLLLLIISFYSSLDAQSVLKGKVYQAETDSAMPAVNIFNLVTRQTTNSDKNGYYEIAAAEGEKIIFSMTGFEADTVTVSFSMLLTQHDVTLARLYISLKPVSVINSYKADSAARRDYYKNVYSQPGITGRNTPTSGVGISLSPLSFFSRESKQKRKLKKRLIKEEQDYYIDRAFPVEWVQRVTGLHGDSLYLFMYRYRPSYSFCRKTDRDGMLIYINDKMKEFKQQLQVAKPG